MVLALLQYEHERARPKIITDKTNHVSVSTYKITKQTTTEL